MRIRAPFAAALAALVALTPLLAAPALASVTPAPKVVIVVGAVEANTARDRADADVIYAEAIKYTPNVIRIYSPNATWAKVKAAAQGASIFIYLGHGYGFPSPYRPVLSPTVHDGMGLNEIGGISDSDKKYYGESLIASDIRLAKNAVVLINHACYSAGSSEAGHPEPTIPVARQRVDNFAAGWIKAGARMVMADSWTSGVTSMIKSIFTTNQTLADVWSNAPNRRGHEQGEGSQVDWSGWVDRLRRSLLEQFQPPRRFATNFNRRRLDDRDHSDQCLVALSNGDRLSTDYQADAQLLSDLEHAGQFDLDLRRGRTGIAVKWRAVRDER